MSFWLAGLSEKRSGAFFCLVEGGADGHAYDTRPPGPDVLNRSKTEQNENGVMRSSPPIVLRLVDTESESGEDGAAIWKVQIT
ncbi:hypothetical protein MRX96_049830 [Rhipicephalus microplus]